MPATWVSPEAVATTKRQLYADLLSSDVGASVEESKRLISLAVSGPDFAEGVAAFVERRPPRFSRLTAPTPPAGATGGGEPS